MKNKDIDDLFREKESEIIRPLPDHLWSRLEKKLDGATKNSNRITLFRPWMSIAAGIALILGCFFILNLIQENKENELALSNAEFINSLEDIPLSEKVAEIPSIQFQRFLINRMQNGIQEGAESSLKPSIN